MLKFTAALASFAFAAAAHAGVTWVYNSANPALDANDGVNTAAGTASAIQASFNTNSDTFTWNVVFSDGVARDTDGYWLVVSPGQLPRGTADEHAIIYFDATNLATPTVSIYRYNGENNATSFQNPGDLLATTRQAGQTTIIASAIQSGAERSFNLTVNAAAINALFPGQVPAWNGIEFGQELGMWFHPLSDMLTSYSGNNLTSFGHIGPGGWYDGRNIRTVPTPGVVALAGVAGLLAIRRRR